MKKITEVVAILVLIGFAGCKKTDSNNITAKIKTHTHQYSGSTTTDTYVYDNQGRASLVTSKITTGGGYTINTITYDYNSVPNAVIYANNANPDTILLNGNGYANNFNYDASGHRISELTTGTVYTWVNENLTNITEATSSTTFTYLTNKTNTISNANFGIYYYGKDSENLVDSIQSVTNGNWRYSYTYDSQDRVIERIGGDSYTYY